MSERKPVLISKGRFEAFSDGVFAIAITLLVLTFQPPKPAALNQTAVLHSLLSMWPQYLVYFASFATVGIMWFNHYALFHHAKQISYAAMVANLGLLLFVAFLPYPTLLLAQFGLAPVIVAFYGLTLIAISAFFNVLWYVATLPRNERGTFLGFLRTRNFWNTGGPIVYIIGSGLAFVSPVLSVVLFALLALYYMAPSTVQNTLTATAAAHSEDEQALKLD